MPASFSNLVASVGVSLATRFIILPDSGVITDVPDLTLSTALETVFFAVSIVFETFSGILPATSETLGDIAIPPATPPTTVFTSFMVFNVLSALVFGT